MFFDMHNWVAKCDILGGCFPILCLCVLARKKLKKISNLVIFVSNWVEAHYHKKYKELYLVTSRGSHVGS